MKTLNIIGAGRVGRTLASLWEEKHTFAIGDVLDRTPHGARSAVAFIGDGRAADSLDDMKPADAWMLTPPDAAIVRCCEWATSCFIAAARWLPPS
jgi:predicted dinucleotide-binding enzyme